MPSGVYRLVILFGGMAVKFPKLRNVKSGMRCNRWEREMWQTWRPVFGWENLCPIIFADPLGLVVIMPRAKQPVTFEQVIAATPNYYPDITSETKPEDFGSINDNIFALDYGLPDIDIVKERRAYYKKMAPNKD